MIDWHVPAGVGHRSSQDRDHFQQVNHAHPECFQYKRLVLVHAIEDSLRYCPGRRLDFPRGRLVQHGSTRGSTQRRSNRGTDWELQHALAAAMLAGCGSVLRTVNDFAAQNVAVHAGKRLRVSDNLQV